jgi:hypothetical protein
MSVMIEAPAMETFPLLYSGHIKELTGSSQPHDCP